MISPLRPLTHLSYLPTFFAGFLLSSQNKQNNWEGRTSSFEYRPSQDFDKPTFAADSGGNSGCFPRYAQQRQQKQQR